MGLSVFCYRIRIIGLFLSTEYMIKLLQFITDWYRGYSTLLGSASRSPQWTSVRNKYLKDHPKCEVCETTGKLLNGLEVHHCIPFSVNPLKELEPTNLIVLCRKDHFLFGHLNSWKSENPNVRIDAQVWYFKIRNRQ